MTERSTEVSSLIDSNSSSVGAPAGSNGASRIIHFDATLRRKEKMRRKAQHEPTAARLADSPPTAAPNQSASAVGTIEQSAGHTPAQAMPETVSRPVVPAPVVSKSSSQPTPPPSSTASQSAASKPAKPVATALNEQELERFLVNFVVEQTGYPEEMVELDADLEADLGIDSIKKAQLFGELAEHLDVQIQVTEDMSLDDFPTLRDVMNFLQQAPQAETASAAQQTAAVTTANRSPETATPIPAATPQPMAAATRTAAPTPTGSAVSGSNLNEQELESFLVNFVVEQTGYPEEMVELDADLEADLGIDSIKKAQLFGELAEHLDIQIQVTEDMSLDDFPTLRDVMNFLMQAAPTQT